jgi:heme-degrading monooxygenase HmoA
VLFLKPVAGDCAAIQQYFDDEGVLERSSRTPGFLGAELQLPIGGSGAAMVTALWTTPEAYRTWVEDPWRAANAERAAAVFEPVEQPGGGGSLYEVTTVVAPSGPTPAEAGPTPAEVSDGDPAGKGAR